MQNKLENRLMELKGLLKALSPETASQTPSLDYLQMQTYILGFQEASKIALSSAKDFKNDVSN